jgi:toxin YoeB
VTREIVFRKRAWDDYIHWQTQDKKTLKRINSLISDILRSPFEGIGKPEPLEYELSGLWSRRIDEVNRIVYLLQDEKIVVFSCKGHYGA